MSDVGINLRKHLLGDAAIAAVVGERIHQNKVPQGFDRPTIWFMRRTTENEEDLACEAGEQPFRQTFDLEVATYDIDTTIDTATLVRSRLHNHRGEFGDGKVQGVFVEDHDDDYFPKTGSSDDGLHVAALSITIVPRG